MNSWSNIEVSSDDNEILAINQQEQTLGKIPIHIHKIRELITRFEMCHFKYKKHIKIILDSIAVLKPTVGVDKIGINHPRHGVDAVMNDTTGRSQIGLEYISALNYWLNDTSFSSNEDLTEVKQKVMIWLCEKNDKKKS